LGITHKLGHSQRGVGAHDEKLTVFSDSTVEETTLRIDLGAAGFFMRWFMAH
jgi:hypothetical protein